MDVLKLIEEKKLAVVVLDIGDFLNRKKAEV